MFDSQIYQDSIQATDLFKLSEVFPSCMGDK